MIKDSSKGQFSVVITWKNDRFARSRYDSATYKFKLKQNGVKVLYAKESIPEGPEGIILESVMEGYAEYYSANLSQNVKRGMYDSALKLQTLGQTVYGLQKDPDGKWEQNPAQAPIVRRIYLVETFLQAAYLYDDGRVLLHLNYSGNNNKISVKIAEKVVNEGEELCSNFAPFSAPKF